MTRTERLAGGLLAALVVGAVVVPAGARQDPLAIDGVLLTMYDSRLNLCRQVAKDAKEYFGPKVFNTVIPRNVRLAEAPSFGKPILMYDVQSVGAKGYLSVAQELLKRAESGELSAEIELPRGESRPVGEVRG